jgi:hypothetical protein
VKYLLIFFSINEISKYESINIKLIRFFFFVVKTLIININTITNNNLHKTLIILKSRKKVFKKEHKKKFELTSVIKKNDKIIKNKNL